MTWTLPETMLAAPVSDPALLPGWAVSRSGTDSGPGLRRCSSGGAAPGRGTEMLPAFRKSGPGPRSCRTRRAGWRDRCVVRGPAVIRGSAAPCCFRDLYGSGAWIEHTIEYLDLIGSCHHYVATLGRLVPSMRDERFLEPRPHPASAHSARCRRLVMPEPIPSSLGRCSRQSRHAGRVGIPGTPTGLDAVSAQDGEYDARLSVAAVRSPPTVRPRHPAASAEPPRTPRGSQA